MSLGTVEQHSYRSLFVTFSDLECVLKDGVHDPSNAEGRLDYIWNNFLHCGQQRQTEVVCYKSHHHFPDITLLTSLICESHHAESYGTASH